MWELPWVERLCVSRTTKEAVSGHASRLVSPEHVELPCTFYPALSGHAKKYQQQKVHARAYVSYWGWSAYMHTPVAAFSTGCVSVCSPPRSGRPMTGSSAAVQPTSGGTSCYAGGSRASSPASVW